MKWILYTIKSHMPLHNKHVTLTIKSKEKQNIDKVNEENPKISCFDYSK